MIWAVEQSREPTNFGVEFTLPPSHTRAAIGCGEAMTPDDDDVDWDDDGPPRIDYTDLVSSLNYS